MLDAYFCVISSSSLSILFFLRSFFSCSSCSSDFSTHVMYLKECKNDYYFNLIRDPPSFLCIFYNALLRPLKVLDIGSKGNPNRRVHVDVLFVRNVLLVDHIGLHPPLIVLPLQDVVEPFLKVLAVPCQVGAGVLAEEKQLTLM